MTAATLDPALDFAEYVLRVIGYKRVMENIDKPVEEWKITDRMRRLILAYPHGIVDEKTGERPFAGGLVTWYSITCACGEKFGADHMLRLRTHAYAAYAAHAGIDYKPAPLAHGRSPRERRFGK